MRFSHALEDGYQIFWTSCFPVFGLTFALSPYVYFSLSLFLLFFSFFFFSVSALFKLLFSLCLVFFFWFSACLFLCSAFFRDYQVWRWWRIVHECQNVCDCCSLSFFSPLIFSKSYTSLKKCSMLKFATWNLTQETWRKGNSIWALLYTENI